MKKMKYIHVLGLVLTLLLANGALWQVDAAKPEWAGDKSSKKVYKNKGQKNTSKAKGSESVRSDKGYFTERDREVVRNYYRDQYRSGNCPPGLAKKNNGCMPPGQAKKYSIGKRLPADIELYDLPRSVLRQLESPPSGSRYVRVDSDILMITEGTRMVVDALENLSQ